MPSTTKDTTRRRAVGIVRVSRKGDRDGDSFASPADQLARIAAECDRQGLQLVSGPVEEISVSGGKPLEKRRGLAAQVEAIEAGRAEVLVVAYFDRLIRSLKVQGEIVSRVEAAGGEVLTVDFGKVSEKTAATWLSGQMMGMFSEYYRRSVGERTHEAKSAAIMRGVAPYDVTKKPGYSKDEDGRLQPDDDAPLVEKAFDLRAAKWTIKEIREQLREDGLDLTYRQVQIMLEDRLYLGELRFGELFNPKAHRPLVERPLFDKVQRVKVSRGRRAKSDRLLARLGVLRCGTCGGRLVVGMSHAKRAKKHGDGVWPIYRCSPTSDCPRRVTISADIAEEVVVSATRAALADVEGRASAESSIREKVVALEQSQEKLDNAIRALADLGAEAAAMETLATLKADRDAKQEAVDEVGDVGDTLVLKGDEDWDKLDLEEQRDLIKATVARADVKPGGRGAERIAVTLA